MRRINVFALIMALSLTGFSQDSEFETGMKNGFDLFNNGEDHKAWIAGAESMVELSKKYSGEWLPLFWASYMNTQIARASSENPPAGVTSEGLLDQAQKYLNMAATRLKDKTSEQEVDIHMLQKLIYDFRKAPANDKEKFRKLAQNEVKASLKRDPNHPTVLVDLGLDLYFRGDLGSVAAARVLLLQAKAKFDSRLVPRYMSTQYAEQWVNYWEPQTRNRIIELTSK